MTGSNPINSATPLVQLIQLGGIVEYARRFLKGRIASTAGWLLVWKIVVMASSLIVGIWLARYLGPEQYGIYAYVHALIALVLPLAQFGLNGIIVKELKLAPEQEPEILGSAIALRVLGALAAAAVMLVIASFSSITTPHFLVIVGLVGAAGAVGALRITEGHFLAKEAPKAYVLGAISVSVCLGVLKIGFILQEGDLTVFLLLTAVETVLAGLMALYVYARRAHSLSSWRLKLSLVTIYVRRAFPLILSGLTAVVYLKIDVLFLSEMVSVSAAGTYAVASRISEVWYFLPTIIATAVFPRLIELRRDDPGKYRKKLQLVFDFLTVSALLTACLIAWTASSMVQLLFGEVYADAAIILAIHVWAGVFVFQRALLSKWLLAEDLYALSFLTHAGGAVINVVLNLLLIPHFGGVGAAVSTVISYAVASSGVLWLTRSGRPAARMMALSLVFPIRAVARAATSFNRYRGLAKR